MQIQKLFCLTLALCAATTSCGSAVDPAVAPKEMGTGVALRPSERTAAASVHVEAKSAEQEDGFVDAATAGSLYQPCPKDGACRIMPFGDSITDGYSPSTPGGYRVELFRLLHRAGKNVTFVGSGSNGPAQVERVPFPPKHEGHSGWTIAPAGGRSGISTLVASVMPQHRPHVVLLMIGMNDAIDNHDMANAPRRLGALIDGIYARLPSVLIIVAQPVPARGDASKGDDTALNARLRAFGAAIPAVVKQRADAGKHILLVDMHTAFLAERASLLSDQWHPNAKGYALIGAQWFAALEPHL